MNLNNLYRENGIDRWIANSYRIGPHALAICRIFFSFHVLFFLFRPMHWIGEYPSIFYHPPLSLAALFDGFPPTWFFHGLNVVAIFAFLGVLLGYRTKWSSILLFGVLFTYANFAHAFGKIDHTILFTFFPLIMAFSNWGKVWSLDANRDVKSPEIKGWPVTLIALLLGFTMFTSGYYKLASGWLDLSTQATHSKIFSGLYAWQRNALLAGPATRFQAPVFWEVLDWITVWWEILFLPALFFPKIFRWFVGFAVFFHLGILLTLNIDFSINLLVYLPFLNWAKLENASGSWGESFRSGMSKLFQLLHPWMLFPLLGIFVWVLYTTGCVWKGILGIFSIQGIFWSGLIHLGGAAILVLISIFIRKKNPSETGTAEPNA